MARSRSSVRRDLTLGGATVTVGALVTLVAWALGARLGAALTLALVTCIAIGLVTLGVDARSRARPPATGSRRPGERPAAQAPPRPTAPPRARATRRKR